MSQKLDTKRLADTLVGGAKKYIDKALDDFNDRLAALETAENQMRFMGTFQRAIDYRKNNLLTHDGSLWIALKDAPAGKPSASEDWQLVAKRGADGRDCK